MGFEESVNTSLRKWFNYGHRSHYEMMLTVDMPYISFPLRSIDNWIDRMQNPEYMRILNKLMMGIYGQFDTYREDETPWQRKRRKQYLNYMMAQGWIPIGGNTGLRLGNSVMDIQSILSSAGGTIEQRMSPTVRAAKSLVDTRDLEVSVKQLATVGALSKAARALAFIIPPLQEPLSSIPGANIPEGGVHFSQALSPTYKVPDYMFESNNTPYQYRMPKNARYHRYENVYRQWYNKYGKLRKPPKNPYYLVKDIQWQQYVRWKQTQARLKY